MFPLFDKLFVELQTMVMRVEAFFFKTTFLFIFGCDGSSLLQAGSTLEHHTGLSLLWLLLSSLGSRAHGLSCPEACGIFSDQRSNPVPCVDSQILIFWTIRQNLRGSIFVLLNWDHQLF